MRVDGPNSTHVHTLGDVTYQDGHYYINDLKFTDLFNHFVGKRCSFKVQVAWREDGTCKSATIAVEDVK